MTVRAAVLGTCLVAVLASVAACVNARPATDTGNTVAPTALPGPNQPLAYEPDIRQLFASDCVYCHGGYRSDKNYRLTTYEEFVFPWVPGNPITDLVLTTQPDGSMFIYFTGSESMKLAKSRMVYDWVVTYKAQRTR